MPSCEIHINHSVWYAMLRMKLTIFHKLMLLHFSLHILRTQRELKYED